MNDVIGDRNPVSLVVQPRAGHEFKPRTLATGEPAGATVEDLIFGNTYIS
ncbi:unannotated protein [freshwater metagenome]|uniref:Unannotated protein n=1 Tax=freshwater metagenome TaxID=449393 RepID=A0A6J7N3J4_9ZZZZ